MDNGIARVFVNGVEVGSLPADEYRELIKKVRRDKRLYLGQAWNILVMVLRVFWTSARYVPTMIALLACVPILFQPSVVTDVIGNLQRSNPSEIAEGLRRLVSMVLAANVIAYLAGLGAGLFKPGYVNYFDAAICSSIRKTLEVPVEGNMRVVVVTTSISSSDEQ